jgi:hypothetical protein
MGAVSECVLLCSVLSAYGFMSSATSPLWSTTQIYSKFETDSKLFSMKPLILDKQLDSIVLHW